jgi:hypothetical protein
MTRDTLFLLAPGFFDNERREYCPECAEMWGLLAYYPSIIESVEIVYQPIVKPRTEIVDMLGEKNQNCPTLVLSEYSPAFENCGVLHKNGHRFINNARDIGRYYSQRYGTAVPRGTGPF